MVLFKFVIDKSFWRDRYMPILEGHWRRGVGGAGGVACGRVRDLAWSPLLPLLSVGCGTRDVAALVLCLSSGPTKPLLFFAHH